MLERVVEEHPRTEAALVALETLLERGWIEDDAPEAGTITETSTETSAGSDAESEAVP